MVFRAWPRFMPVEKTVLAEGAVLAWLVCPCAFPLVVLCLGVRGLALLAGLLLFCRIVQSAVFFWHLSGV